MGLSLLFLILVAMSAASCLHSSGSVIGLLVLIKPQSVPEQKNTMAVYKATDFILDPYENDGLVLWRSFQYRV